MNIALVEDDARQIENVARLLSRYDTESGSHSLLTSYTSAEDFLMEYRYQFDLILMDICLQGGMNGLAAAKKMREKDASVSLIFITDMAQFALEGYKYNAMDYWVKPVVYMHLKLRLDQVQKKILLKAQDEELLKISFNGIPKFCPIPSIYYIESQAHTLIFHTKEGEFQSREKSMRDLAQQLYPFHFRQCNSGILVNLKHCSGITREFVKVLDTELPISRAKRKQFIDEMAKYFSNKTIGD